MEIVTHPHLTCGSDALAFVRELHLLLRTLGTFDGNTTGTLYLMSLKLDRRCVHSGNYNVRTSDICPVKLLQ